ncbi:hypothetical protein [Lysobacter capsici]|uniref:hypothetical protein n=1 Tax=Lysobacter capsici TaxID=435897 RepID=UPI000699C548|nr:hypothetical protein [Lysobacter capsici]
MAEHHFQLIPVDPRFYPDPDTIDTAQAVVRALIPSAEEVHASCQPGIQYFDAGEGFEEPQCPFCDADTAPWWRNAMSAAWGGTHFNDLRITTPCCGASTSLDQLRYPNGDRFGSFIIQATLADPVENPSPAQIAQLESILGCQLADDWIAR